MASSLYLLLPVNNGNLNQKNMKEINYDWLLDGCHPRSAVAVAYFGNYLHACSAVKAFLRTLRKNIALLSELEAAEFSLAKTSVLTPRQIAILVEHWGMPAKARDTVNRFPHLLESKLHRFD